MVKKSVKIIAALAALVMLLGVAYAVANRNSASASVTSSQQAVPPPGDAYTYDGNIRPADNSHWCLTYSPVVTNDAPLFMAPCVKGFPRQQFFVWRTPQIGGINLPGHPDWQVAHKVRYSIAVLTDSNDQRRYTTLLAFTPYEKGWLIDTKQGRVITFLTVPSHLKLGNPIYAKWQLGSGKTRKSQEWLLGPWKHLAP